MASLAANTATVTILQESASSVLVSLMLHQDTAGDESSVLKVNTATLTSRTVTLNFNGNFGPYGYVPGSTITGLSSGAIGTVRSYNARDGKLDVILTSGTFTTENINGSTLNTTATVASVTVPTYFVDVHQVWYSVNGIGKVGLEFANATTFSTALTVSGNGYFGPSQLPGLLKSSQTALVNPNGNLYVSTYGTPAKGGYSLVLELRKAAGFSPKPGY